MLSRLSALGMRAIGLCLAALLLVGATYYILLGCSSSYRNIGDLWAADRTPLEPRPEQLRGVSIFVAPEIATTTEHEAYATIVPALIPAVNRALTQAGYAVASAPDKAALSGHMTLEIRRTETVTMNNSSYYTLVEATATLIVESKGEVVADIAVSPSSATNVTVENYADFVSIECVNRLSRSPRVYEVLAGAGHQEPAPETGAGAAKKRQSITVAVFDIDDARKQFEAQSIDQLTDYLAAILAQSGTYRVIPREQLRSRLVEKKAESYKSCVDESCQIELGKAVAAEKSLATKLLRVGNTCAMTATLYDLRSETTERAASAKTECTENALIGGVEDIVRQLTAPGSP